MDHLSKTLFRALRDMDSEADTIRNGSSTGLYWYAGHTRPELKKPQTEPEWSKRLATLLTRAGYPAKHECRYPSNHRQRCDVVIDIPIVEGENADGSIQSDKGRLWLEIKGAWKSWWLAPKRGGEAIHRSYLAAEMAPDMPHKSHTAALDIRKLESISMGDASHVGFLMIGFDNEKVPMEPELATFADLTGLNRAPWMRFADAWPDSRRQPGEWVRCWAWLRTNG